MDDGEVREELVLRVDLQGSSMERGDAALLLADAGRLLMAAHAVSDRGWRWLGDHFLDAQPDLANLVRPSTL